MFKVVSGLGGPWRDKTLWIALLCVTCSLLQFATPADAGLTIEGKPRWGFDGRVRKHQFNLLTIVVRNDSNQPFQGAAELSPAIGIARSGTPIIQPSLYIEGYGVRRLQFLVYVDEPSDYRLRWSLLPRDQKLIDEPQLATTPAAVRFVDRGAVASDFQSRGWPEFADEDFPLSAAGLKGLGTVVLDHAPAWNEAQQRAFLDWLAAGGTVYLPDTRRDEKPFPALLAELNSLADGARFGAGLVLRENIPETPPGEETETRANSYFNPGQRLFGQLRQMTQPDHNWVLILFLAVLYLLALYPGCWYLGRRTGDFRIVYASVLGLVALFSMGFRTIGARGYGESTIIHSLAVVEPASPGRSLVTQWTSAFVTSGDEYVFTHPVEGLMYSLAQTDDWIPGQILNRPRSALLTEIPSFSARTFLHTGVVGNNVLQIAPNREGVFEVNSTKPIAELKGSGWDVGGEELWAGLVVGDTWTPLRREGATLLIKEPAQPLTSMLSDPALWYGGDWSFNNKQPIEELYERSRRLLLVRDLGLTSEEEINSFQLPAGTARLYVYAPLPDTLFAENEQFLQQQGKALVIARVDQE